MTNRKIINSTCKDGRIVLTTSLRVDKDAPVTEHITIMFSPSMLTLISDANYITERTIDLHHEPMALDMAIAKIFPYMNIVCGRIPRSVIEEFREANADILKACGFYDEPTDKESKSNASTVVPDDRTNMLVAGVGIGATIMGVIAALISGKK